MATPDRWSALQNRESSWSRLQNKSPQTLAQPGGATSQVRRQAENYNRANRLLRRQANREKDPRSALALIDLVDKANADGYTPGGVRRKDEFDAGILGRLQSMEKGAVDRETAADINRRTAAIAAGDGDAVAPDAGATVSPETRTSAALDILEGETRQDDAVTQRGLDSATRLGVADPTGILRGDRNSTYRRTLDSALGAARSPAEIAALRSRGTSMGITPSAFDRRADWWNRNRR